MANDNFTNTRDLLNALAEAMNLINPDIENHHQQTAYLAFMLAKRIGLSERSVEMSVYAGLLHDVGSVVLEGRKTVMEIESDVRKLSIIGASMLRDVPSLDGIADIIELCQLSWTDLLKNSEKCGGAICDTHRIASLIHLSDTVSLMLKQGEPVLNQMKCIKDVIGKLGGREYSQEAVQAFLDLTEIEYIWFDMLYHPTILALLINELHYISLERTAELTKIMSRIIDYQSAFTAMHSAGVSASAQKLAELAGFSLEDCIMMKIAGDLHDVGKLKVPKRILEKPGKLTAEEFNIIKEHPYNTRLILMGVQNFEKVADWAGYHHEKLNGRGYPFHFGADRLDTGSRILAVADIFSAITERRPYRDSMPKGQVMSVLKENADRGDICKDVVALLFDHYDEIDSARAVASEEAGKRYFESFN